MTAELKSTRNSVYPDILIARRHFERKYQPTPQLSTAYILTMPITRVITEYFWISASSVDPTYYENVLYPTLVIMAQNQSYDFVLPGAATRTVSNLGFGTRPDAGTLNLIHGILTNNVPGVTFTPVPSKLISLDYPRVYFFDIEWNNLVA